MKKFIVSVLSIGLLFGYGTYDVSAKEKLNYSLLTIVKGSSKTLKVKGTKKKVTWQSMNNSIASVSKKGVVKAKKAGYAKIVATTSKGDYTCEVIVSSIPYIYPKSSKMGIGQVKDLMLVNNKSNIKWSSTNKNILSINKNGTVSAKKTGTATIKAKAGGRTYSRKITVTSNCKDQMNINSQKTLPKPGKVTKWISSNKDVISVSNNGKIKALKAGKSVITAKSGKKKYTYTLTVNQMTLSNSAVSLDKGEETNLYIHHCDQKASWTSNDQNVATVDENGLVKGVNSGTTTITAKVGEDSFQATVTVSRNDVQNLIVHGQLDVHNNSSDDGINALVIGNSLTLHPNNNQFWWGEWGMSATTAEKDYVHVLTNKISKKTNINTSIANFGDWELAKGDKSVTYPLIDHYLKPDLDMVVIQLGENSGYSSSFASDFTKLMQHIYSEAPNAQIYLLSNYNDAKKADQAKKNIVKKYSRCHYINLEAIHRTKAYCSHMNDLVYGEDGMQHKVNNAAVASHPNDQGMKMIADAIYESYLMYNK